MLTSLILAVAFTLQTPDFPNGGTIPIAFANNTNGCTGQNRTPALHWSGVPPNAKELALTVWDPDAPAPGGFVHWLVFNIPTSWHALPVRLKPPAFAATNGFGQNGYGGPCPPPGDPPHHYIFTLDALDANLPLSPKTTYARYLELRRGHVIASEKLIGRYGRR